MQKKYYLTLLAFAFLLIALMTTPTPVKAADVSFYVKDPSDGDNIYAGVAPPPPFPPPPPNLVVYVYVDSPASWLQTADGIISVMVSVRVNPTVLTCVGIGPAGDIDGDGYTDDLLDMYAMYLTYYVGGDYGTIQGPPAKDTSTGTMAGYASAMTGVDWDPALGGAGGNPFFGGSTAALCKLEFVTKTATVESLIDLMGPGIDAEQYVDEIKVSCKYTQADGDVITVEPDDGYYVAPVDTMYLDTTSASFDPASPLYTDWHELAPIHCQDWTLESWDDQGTGVLDESDQIDLVQTDPPTGTIIWGHVDWLNPTPIAGDGKADLIITVKPEVPEFPLGLELIMAFALMTPLVYLWRRKGWK
jgi:hypothetical protein